MKEYMVSMFTEVSVDCKVLANSAEEATEERKTIDKDTWKRFIDYYNVRDLPVNMR